MNPSQEPNNSELGQFARGAQVAGVLLESLALPPDPVTMVLVSGPPDGRRISKRLELEAALEASGSTVLSAKALGADRSHVGQLERRAAAAAKVEFLFVLSLVSVGDEEQVVVEVWELGSDTMLTRIECALDDWSMSRPTGRADEPSREPKAKGVFATSRSRYVLESPSVWRPRLGVGVRARPVLRDTRSGKWIPFDEAYALVARDDWQVAYDRRNAGRVAMSSVGSLFFVGGATAMAVFAWRPMGDDPGVPLDTAAFSLGMGSALLGTGLVVAGLLLDPHPVSSEEFEAQLDRSLSQRESLSFRVHAGPSGASAGLRASF